MVACPLGVPAKPAPPRHDQISCGPDRFLAIKDHLAVLLEAFHFRDQIGEAHGVFPGIGSGVPGGDCTGVARGALGFGCALLAGAGGDAAAVAEGPGCVPGWTGGGLLAAAG